MRVLGVDPGISGALAIVEDYRLIGAYNMPVASVRVGKATKRRIIPAQLCALIMEQNVDRAIIEKVAAMPGQGVASMFAFGEAYGLVQGVLAACGVPVTFITPMQWKRKAGLIGQPKDHSRTIACERWPHQSAFFARKSDHGRADAALLACVGIGGYAEG